MKRAVLLDVFGTLVRFKVRRRPFSTLLRGLTLTRSQNVRWRRLLMTSTVPSLADAAKALAVEIGQEPAEAAIDAAGRELREHLASCQLSPGALPLLRELRADGYALALVSNLASVYVPVLEQLGVRELVDAAVYSCEVGLSKPDPAIFRLGLKQLAAAPQDATMVGDSLRADVLGAKATGLRAVWITERDDPAHVCLARIADLRGVLR